MTPDEIRHLPTRRIGRTVHVYDRLKSTNRLGLSLGDDEENDGLVILAREQTAGHGQHGRSWTSPADNSVLLSVLIFPPDEIRRPVLLTAWAAVGVCETIEELTGLTPTIKWPNDVLINGRKVCGILIEQRQVTVVGIGLNVQQDHQHFLDAELPDATSLFLATQRRFDASSLAACLCGHLDDDYSRLLRGRMRLLESKWRSRLGLVGREVIAEHHNGIVRARLHRLDFQSVALSSASYCIEFQPERLLHLTAINSAGSPATIRRRKNRS